MSVSTNKLSRFFSEHSCPSWLLDSVTRILPLNFLFLIFNWFFVSHQCAFGYSAYVLRSFSCNLHPTLSLILPYYMVIVLSYLPLVISSVLLTLYFYSRRSISNLFLSLTPALSWAEKSHPRGVPGSRPDSFT